MQMKVFKCLKNVLCLGLIIWMVKLVLGFFSSSDDGATYARIKANKGETNNRQVWNIFPSNVSECALKFSIDGEKREGLTNDAFSLVGLLILFKHGDRAPLSHILGSDKINCEVASSGETVSDAYANYTSFVDNVRSTTHLLGPLGAISLLPPDRSCSIGQLTPLGIDQILRLSLELRVVPEYAPFMQNVTPKDAMLYSTRNRRSVQSGVAFLYGFIGERFLYGTTLEEAVSYAYCFDYCSCPKAEIYRQRIRATYSQDTNDDLRLTSHLSNISFVLLPTDPSTSRDAYRLKDAMLAYACHRVTSSLCAATRCLSPPDVTSLIDLLAKQYERLKNMREAFEYSRLKAYGLIRNLVDHMLNIASGRAPKIILHSVHDKTIRYLLNAFGVNSYQVAFPPYASRIVIEMYREKNGFSAIGHHFRVLFNGRDVTNELLFCENHATLLGGNRTAFLCRLETIVRFVHDDYFDIFSANNYKDACRT